MVSDPQRENMDYWEEFDSKVAQTLANYLGIEVAGFAPETNVAPTKLDRYIAFPDLDVVLRDNNIFMMRTMILSGLVHEASEHRRFILANIDSGVFWEKSFQRYLFDLMRQQIHKNGEVSTEWLFYEIPKYTKVVYGSPEDRRDQLGNYYRWVQILELHPSWDQILRAMDFLKATMRSSD